MYAHAANVIIGKHAPNRADPYLYSAPDVTVFCAEAAEITGSEATLTARPCVSFDGLAEGVKRMLGISLGEVDIIEGASLGRTVGLRVVR